MRRIIIPVLLILMALAMWFCWEFFTQMSIPIGMLLNQDREYMVDSKGTPIVVRSIWEVHNPTFQQVVDFARNSKISDIPYEPGKFMCTEYAMLTREKAREQGMRCGIASLQYSRGIGHAMCVFHTTDKGLVFLDLTGSSDEHEAGIYTTIGYVEKGKPYGRLPLDIASIDPHNYARYAETQRVWGKIRERSLDIKEERAVMDARDAQLKAISKDIQGQRANIRTQDDNEQINEAIRRYNIRLSQFRTDCDALNKKVEAFNAANHLMERHYVENPYDVTEITFWWW